MTVGLGREKTSDDDHIAVHKDQVYKEGIEYHGRFRYPQIILATWIKFFANTASRFAYPFAPFLSEELDVSVAAYNAAIATGEASTLTATFVGPLGDFLGKRDIMIVGQAIMVAGLAAMGISPSLSMLYVSRVLFGIGFSLFFPTMQSYLGMYVPVALRGRVTGLIESAWALSGLLGLYIMGTLIDVGGIRWPFISLAIALAIMMLFLPFLLRNDKKDRITDKAPVSATAVFFHLLQMWKTVLGKKVSYLIILMGFMQSFGGTLVFASYGLWLERVHHKDVVFVGQTTIGLGATEFCGAMAVTMLADRVGLKRAVTGSLFLLALSYVTLALVSSTLIAGLAVSFLSFGIYEIALISSIAIVSEILPRNRNVITTLYLAALAIARLTGALLVEPLWHEREMIAIGLVAGSAVLVSLVSALLIRFPQVTAMPTVALDDDSLASGSRDESSVESASSQSSAESSGVDTTTTTTTTSSEEASDSGT